MTPRRTRVRPIVMDRPVLHSLVERLRAEERLQQFAAALPTRARVSEPVLPLVLAALHEELGRGLIVLLPEDADARDAAEAAAWFLGDDHVALFPSRGVHWESGLEPPPHLVGERARALEVLERGGLVCASAAAVAEGLPPRDAAAGAAPRRARRRARDRRARRAPRLGRLRARRARRGARPVRGPRRARRRLPDDRAASRSASSSSATRSSRSARSRRSRSARCGRSTSATIYPAAERRRELVEIDLGPDEGEERRAGRPRRPRAAVRPRARPRLVARRGAGGLGGGGPRAGRRSTARPS